MVIGELNSIGQTLNIEELKGRNVARCIEKSGSFNGLTNFMGIDCSLVLSDATFENNTAGHAYCLVQIDGKSKICDPNFRDDKMDENGKAKGIFTIFDLDTNNKNNCVTFNFSTLGGSQKTVQYNFPWEKLKSSSKCKVQVTSQDISTLDKNEKITSSEIEWFRGLIKNFSDKLRGEGEKE